MGRFYTSEFTNQATTAAQDMLQIEAITGIVVIHQIIVGQTLDVGDAAAENLAILIRRVTDTVTNVTVEGKLDPGDPAALANLNVNQTTQLVAGVKTLHAEIWNIALPFVFLPPPELRIVIRPADALVVTLPNPSDPLTVSATMYFEEIG